MDERDQNELGTIRISDDAIGTIAALAALEVQGVAATAHGTLDGMAESLGLKPAYSRGVKVDVTEEEVFLDINLILEFGVDIPAICQKAQDKVREAVEDMTGLNVARVNISVQSVRMKKDPTARVAR
jgi:uncharacterized alkaline shock family protein YloU